MLHRKDGAWLLRKLGIHRTQYTEIEDILENSESTEENVAFQKRLKANYQVGYWEVMFLHTKALLPVPKNMRPK